MAKYAVTLMTVMSTVINVEADSREEAIEAAFDLTPSPSWDWPDIGDWQLPSEMFPESMNDDDDVSAGLSDE